MQTIKGPTLLLAQFTGDTAPFRFLGVDHALAWPYAYPRPQRQAGPVAEAFGELARRWWSILDHAEDCGIGMIAESKERP